MDGWHVMALLCASCVTSTPGVDAGDARQDGGGTARSRDANPGAPETRRIEMNLAWGSEFPESDFNPPREPYDVYLLDTATGLSVPGFEAPVRTQARTGKLVIEGVPAAIVPALHVVGKEAADPADLLSATGDTITLNLQFDSGGSILRLRFADLSGLDAAREDYVAVPDRAALLGTVYATEAGPGSRRIGTRGCAQVYLDGSRSPFARSMDQYYFWVNWFDTPAELRDQTDYRGRFGFGNLTTGAHTVRVSFDEGETFVAEQTFVVPLARADAIGPEKDMTYVLGVDVPSEDLPPTPCPLD